MTLSSIMGLSGAGVFIVILGLIKIKPLEISIWSWLARKVGRAFNGETNDRLDKIEETMEKHIADDAEKEALRRRTSILRFADEMYESRYHSRDHFEEILECIDLYDDYCSKHAGFKNGRTDSAEKIIRAKYEECMKRGSFDRIDKSEAR